jgi:sugar lactone lactonase YvrE
MNTRSSFIAASLLVSAQLSIALSAQAETFSTLIKTPLTIEGLTNDNRGNLYTPGRNPGAGQPCPVWRVNIATPSLVVVGLIPAPTSTTQCSPSGLAFDRLGTLYVTETDKIYRFFPNSSAPPVATLFASGVPGTNGLAFDRHGNIWTGDGTTGQGRVWKIDSAGVVTEMFRVQPMANDISFDIPNPTPGGDPTLVRGIGRDARTLPPGTINLANRMATNILGSQPLVANGLQFTKDGDLLIADTARGAIWKAKFGRDGQLRSRTGCDATFTDNTLCLENVLVAHPLLEGVDGIVLDQDDNIWADANERNAVVLVTGNDDHDHDNGRVIEVFRNPLDANQLRNSGPLETPASPALSDRTLCTSNSDGNRRDNFPSTAGEIRPLGPDRGKISCMDQRVRTRGATLPVR